MYKVAKVISVLLAVSLLLAVSGVLFAQTLDVTLDRDFISNAAPGFTTTTVTITDKERNVKAGADNDTIATTSIQVLNVQTGDTIDIEARESLVESVFTATFTVNSITSTVLTEIMAADGQQLRVNYTTEGGSKISARTPTSLPFVNEVLVDGTGPVITNTSPAHKTNSRFATQTFQADITDTAAGLGADDAAVRPRITFVVEEESLPLTLAPNADATVWTAQVQTIFLTAGKKEWQITARDALGNVTMTDSETADGADGDQLFIVRIDITAAGLAGATSVVGGTQARTGDVADTSDDPAVNDETADNRKSIRVGFNEALDGTSINADGSDFLVLDGGTQLEVSSADWYSDIEDSVYLTLVNDLDPDSTPVIRVVREIEDLAGNPTVAGEVTALDGLPPAVTVSLLVGTAESTLTNDTLTIRVVADESSVDPAEAFDLVGVDGLLVAKHDADGAVFVTSTAKAGTLTTLSAGTQWEWEFTFDASKTADDEGVYNVYAAISDSEGNMGVAGLRLGGAAAAALVEFQVDRGIPFDAARDIAYSDDDPNTFINIDFGGEGRAVDEYVGDSHDTVSAVTATIDGVSVEVSTIDNITFTIPPQALSVTDHLLEVEATDEAGNTVFFDDLEIKIVERADFSIPLRPGLNIVSLPGGPSSAAINDVIPSTHPINQVFTYDPTKAGGWLVAERGDDGLFVGTLTSINDKLAYFVRTTSFEPVAVFIPRLSATERVLPPAIALKKGWNLVPVADTSGDMDPGDTVSAVDYLDAIDEARVYRLDTFGRLVPVNMTAWDTTTPDTAAERAAKSLIVGHGYWVYANADGVIIP